jgi:anti-sigma factor RsiW
MDHETARSLFINYQDGDLPEGERLALEKHLEGCRDCRAEWEAYQRTVGEISELRVVSVPDDFATRVSCAIEQRNRRRLIGNLSFLNFRVIVLFVVLIVLLMLVYLTYLMFGGLESSSGAKAYDKGDYHIIGPVQIEPQRPEPKERR